MWPRNKYGQSTLITSTVTASGIVITSANAQIIGVLMHGSGTAILEIFTGTTVNVAGTTVTPRLRSVNGVSAFSGTVGARFYPVGADCPGGITVNWRAEPTEAGMLTLFWNPTGGP